MVCFSRFQYQQLLKTYAFFSSFLNLFDCFKFFPLQGSNLLRGLVIKCRRVSRVNEMAVNIYQYDSSLNYFFHKIYQIFSNFQKIIMFQVYESL